VQAVGDIGTMLAAHTRVKSFFRYPGGKEKLKHQILAKLNEYAHDYEEYREPFFGGGSIGLRFLAENPQIKTVWINDKDPGIAALWTAVVRHPEQLCQRVTNFLPSPAAFYAYKDELLAAADLPTQSNQIVALGFKKLAIHQISYSGLGTKAGGPLGGESQASAYKIDCRWSPAAVCKKINALHAFLTSRTLVENGCTCVDFQTVIENTRPSLLYLDPPYYVKGNDLYQCGFTEADHTRLAATLQNVDHAWVLSYDQCPEIRSLYQYAQIATVEVPYSITARKEAGQCFSRKKQEFLITPSGASLANYRPRNACVPTAQAFSRLGHLPNTV